MKKAFSIVLCIAMLLALLPTFATAAEIVDSGTCGTNLTWTLDSDGTLTISGTGKMLRYYSFSSSGNYYTTAPWGSSAGKVQRVKTVVIEPGVTSIGEYAFYYCTSLTSVTIPDSVTSIGEYAFYGCSSLSSVTIPDGVTSIWEKAFYGCSSLTSVTIPDSVTSIGGSAFFGNTLILCNKNSYAATYAENNDVAYALLDGTAEENTFSGSVGRLNWTIDRLTRTLTIECVGVMPTFASAADVPWKALYRYVYSAVILDGTTTVSDYAFYGCSILTSVTIPDGVTRIGMSAFYNCTSLTSIEIPDSVTSIGDSAFFGSKSLTSVTIPDSVTSIEQSMFNGCTSLTSVTIPDGVTSIGNAAFRKCESLTSITIPDSVTSIRTNAFRYCTSLIAITIPNGVTYIDENAFNGCTGLTSVTIGNGVTRIWSQAFSDCTSLTSIELPVNVESVSPSAFADCTALESVYFYNPNCSISSGATPANATIYGYAGSTAQTYADNNGLRFMEIDGTHEHHFTATKTVPATCTEDGYRTLACPCGERKTEVLPAAGHTPVEVPAQAATCIENGWEAWSYCAVCGTTLTEKVELPKTDHSPVVSGAVAATCGKPGFTGVTYCALCNEVLDAGEEIPATGEHTPAEATETVVTEATCGRPGGKLVTVKCAVCGETLSEETVAIPATGEHTPAEATETVVREAACTAAGEKRVTVKCAVCGETISEETAAIPATGHEYSMTVTAPTCTASGYTTYTCAHGDSQFIRDLVDPLGHADPNADGKCDRCGATLTPGGNSGDSGSSGDSGNSGNSGGSGRQSFFNSLWAFILNLLNMLKNLFGR